MRILATCVNCDRVLMLDQVLEDPATRGKCPWCGVVMAPDYAEVFVPAIQDAEAAGKALTAALVRLRETGRRVRIDPESVLGPIRDALGRGTAQERDRDRLRPAA